MTQQDWLQRYGDVMTHAFSTPKKLFVRGEGCHVFDADGNRYVDLLAGIAVNSLGHNHPRVVQAVTEQVTQLAHISNLYASEPQIQLAERLASYAGSGRVFFSNSGSEANETALKVTRLTGRSKVVAMTGSFHGRTTGALALTHTPAYREPFEPLAGGVEFVTFGDIEALEGAVDEQTAAVVLEVIQGENGVVALPEGYLQRARQITREAGALLWIDEVQTGMGRCGEIMLHRSLGIDADLVTLAKGLAAGVPIGACIASGPAAELLTPGSHGSTFGGNPLATAVANSVLDELEAGVLDNARAVGTAVREALVGLEAPFITQVRGAGLLIGIELAEPKAAAIAEAALADGWIINAPRANVIRLAPPLIISIEELQPFVEALPGWYERV